MSRNSKILLWGLESPSNFLKGHRASQDWKEELHSGGLTPEVGLEGELLVKSPDSRTETPELINNLERAGCAAQGHRVTPW